MFLTALDIMPISTNRLDAMSMLPNEIRIGIVGCGAVTELAHLPICANTENVKVSALVDTNLERAKKLANEYSVPTVTNLYEELGGTVDAAIVAAPHALHEKIVTSLLAQGIHVLVEKPMGLSAAECDRMIKAADAGGAILAVGLMRRFGPWARFVKSAIDRGAIGRLQRFEVREGAIYSWPVASDFFFRKESAGGGVLIDTGAHTLDSILWWFGEPNRFDYFDDADGGVEADCEMVLNFSDGLVGRVELSRTRDLGNQIHIVGELGTLDVEPGMNRVKLTYHDGQLAGAIMNPKDPSDRPDQLAMMGASFNDWIQAIRGGTKPIVDGREGRRAVALIESCYANRKPMVYPWNHS